MNVNQITPGMRVRHYKGGLYTVVTLARHADSLEGLVVYRSEKDGTTWVRPVEDFCGFAGGLTQRTIRFVPAPDGRITAEPTPEGPS